MRLALLFILGTAALNAGIYKAKVEPFDAYTIAAEAQGRIVALNLDDELRTVSKEVLTIDHALESSQLATLQRKLENLDEQLAIKRDQHQRIMAVSGKSRFEKEQSRLNLLSLEAQRLELLNTMAQLKDLITKKRVTVEGCYIKKLYVRANEYAMPGTKLMRCEDHSLQRIILYADAADATDLHAKQILINGAKDVSYRIDKISSSTDETYISAYRVELVGKRAYRFGEMVTVEIKE